MKEKGLKYDGGKNRWDLLVWDFVNDIVKVITFGASKYEANNWQGIEIDRYFAALHRHIYQYQTGEWLDQESGLPHLAHAGCNLMFIYYLHLKGKVLGIFMTGNKENNNNEDS